MTGGKLEVANEALIEAGIPPLIDLTDETREGEFIRARYETIFQRHASVYRWSFCQWMADLGDPAVIPTTTTIDEPLGRYAFRYPFPAEPAVMAVNAVLMNDQPVDYMIYGQNILTDADGRDGDLILDYLWRAPEDIWPPFVRSFFVMMLAAAVASSVRENMELSQMLEQKGMSDLRTARFTDSKQRTARRLGRSRFSRLRTAR